MSRSQFEKDVTFFWWFIAGVVIAILIASGIKESLWG